MDNNSNYGAMKFEYKVLWNSQMQKKKKIHLRMDSWRINTNMVSLPCWFDQAQG